MKQKQLNNDLIAAIKAWDYNETKRCLAMGACPNASDKDGSPALVLAVKCGRRQVVNGLIAAGAKVDVFDKQNVSPLMHAVFNENEKMIDDLLFAGANPYLRNRHMSTAFDVAKHNINNYDRRTRIIQTLEEATEWQRSLSSTGR